MAARLELLAERAGERLLTFGEDVLTEQREQSKRAGFSAARRPRAASSDSRAPACGSRT